MTVEDWRDAAPADVEPLYRAECGRWASVLDWDLRPSCAIVEQARRSGRLPGLLARDRDGAIVGWTYYLVHEGVLQIGGLVAGTAAGTRQLLDSALQSPEAAWARSLSCYLFPASPSLQCALERQRFSITRHIYMGWPLAARDQQAPQPAAGDLRVRPLADVDLADVVRLAARAYAGQAEARCFAADGRLDQWARYFGQLLATPACGVYAPDQSFALTSCDGRHPVGAVVTTRVGVESAHIAQIVVDPGLRGGGLGQALIGAAAAAAGAAGRTRLTLLVSEENLPARRLYERTGFAPVASFVCGRRLALTRRAPNTPAPDARKAAAPAEARS